LDDGRWRGCGDLFGDGPAQLGRRPYPGSGHPVDLLEAARVATGTLPATRHPLDLRPIVIATVRDIQAAHPGLADIRVTILATPVTLNGDPVRLAQMIANLLDNADKHTPPAPQSRSS